MSNTFYNQQEDFSQDAWRGQFLQRILIISALVGLFALIPVTITTPEFIFKGVYISVYVLLVALILIRLPYLVKATFFILLPLVLGISNLTETGIRGDALFSFLAFITFSALLIGPRAGIASIAISELIIVVLGYLILNDHIRLPAGYAFQGDLWDWSSAAVTQLLISILIVSALRMLNENFQKTHQRAITLQRSQLVSQKELEDRIAERTQGLSAKTNLINAAFNITHQISVLQDFDLLLNRTVTLISEQFECYHTGVYLLNQRGDYLNLQAASSEGGKRLLESGYRIRIGAGGMIGWVSVEKKPRISLNVGMDSISIENPELAETKSELSLPLIVQTKVIGVLDLQASEENAFRYDEIEVFQGMADQVAVAINNARLLSESRLMISQLEIISNENIRQNWKSEAAHRKPSFRYSASGIHPVERSIATKAKNVLDIPIVLRGEKIGRISLQRKAGFHKWTAQEEAIANEVAAQTALALENIRLVERTRERASREQAIANVSARVSETFDLDIVLRTSAREIQKALNLQEAEIRLIRQGDLNNEEKDIEEPFS